VLTDLACRMRLKNPTVSYTDHATGSTDIDAAADFWSTRIALNPVRDSLTFTEGRHGSYAASHSSTEIVRRDGTDDPWYLRRPRA
jgi:hypothetical protein